MGGMTPSDIGAQVLDAIAWPEVLGDLNDGSDHANILLRAYGQCLEQLQRAANWDMCRKEAPLVLLADATGNTALVGTSVPYPWLYSYQYPTDCVKMRFVPWNFANPSTVIPADNIQIPQTPLVDGLGDTSRIGARVRPARFLVATDFNNPSLDPSDYETRGVSPQGRTVILTNVREATGVYTANMIYPSVWDPLFRAAFVAYLASEVALPIWAKKDAKFGLLIRNQQAEIVRAKVKEARLVDGNEGGPSSSDIRTDWIDVRASGGQGFVNGNWGGAGWGAGDGPGVWSYGFDALTVAGAVF